MVLLCASLMSVWLNKKLDLESPRFTFNNCWFYCTVKGTLVGFTSLLQSFQQIDYKCCTIIENL
jgi:hypothetical protein